jgi:hypothetical protein
VITVMVRVENRRWRDVFLLDAAPNRIGFGRVDDGGFFGFFANQQIAVVVTEEWDLMYFHYVSKKRRVGVA